MNKNFKARKMTLESMAISVNMNAVSAYCICGCGMDPFVVTIQQGQLAEM